MRAWAQLDSRTQNVPADLALPLASFTCQVLDIKDDLERHEEAKELVILLTTEAKDDPEIRAQVEHVRWAPPDVAVAADSPNRSSRLLLPHCVRLGSRSCRASESTPSFAGSTTPSIQARPFVDAPRQEALNDSGAPHFRCHFEWSWPKSRRPIG